MRLGKGKLLVLLFVVLSGSAVSAVAPLVLGDSIAGILSGSGTVELSFSGLRSLLLVGIVALLVQFVNQILRNPSSINGSPRQPLELHQAARAVESPAPGDNRIDTRGALPALLVAAVPSVQAGADLFEQSDGPP